VSNTSLAGLARSYQPKTPADWPAPAPTTIAEALDDLGSGSAPGTIQAIRFTLTLAEIQAAGVATGVTKIGPAFPANAVLMGGYADTSDPVQNAGATAASAPPGGLLGVVGLGSDFLISGFDPTTNGGPGVVDNGIVPGISKSTPGYSGAAPFPVGGHATSVSINLTVACNTITTGQVGCVFYYAIVP
jgi:subtilisin family serine protease